MLDIISMTIFLLIFMGIAVILIIIYGGKTATEEERRYEDEEQIRYLKEHNKKIDKGLDKVESEEQEKYTWQQVEGYAIIALNNLLHSANEIDLRNLKMFIKPLKILYSRNDVVEVSERLMDSENNNKKCQ